MTKQNKAYISLKEASLISGYSPDYVGQLIRNGKLPGKQVFQQVVWMTTEDDLREYMEKKRAGVDIRDTTNLFSSLTKTWKREIETPRLAIHALYLVMCIALCLFLLLFYVFSSSLEHQLDQKALEKLQQKSHV